MKLITPVCATVLSLVLLPSCGSDSNSGDPGTGGFGGLAGFAGFGGSSGSIGSGGTTPGGGGTTPATGGIVGAGGIVGTGGIVGAGGTVSSGGAAGAAGAAGTAGTAGTAGAAGTAGTAGAAGNGGTAGNGGAAGAAGNAGNAGSTSSPDGGTDGGATPDASTPDASTPDSGVNCNGATTVDVTRDGTVAASSTSFGFNNRWSATKAVDGDATTAWFGGNGQMNATYTWTGSGEDCITQIDLTQTAMVNTRADWNYQSVTVEVFPLTGTTPLFSQMVQLTGTPAPNPVVNISGNGVIGQRVRLSFTGLQAPHNTGGLAELVIKAKR